MSEITPLDKNVEKNSVADMLLLHEESMFSARSSFYSDKICMIENKFLKKVVSF